MIFVSIAAYRDPQLVPTVCDCIAKARHPDQLRFCVCWQHDVDERLPDWFSGEEFTILDIPFRESRGLCWARAALMDLWNGEDWYLQLDSHHRFAPGWDASLLSQAAATGSAKPVLSTYGAPYSPDGGDGTPTRPTQIGFHAFAAEGDILGRASWMPEGPARPRRAWFASGHFLFARGLFVEDVPCDPDMYFLGEETSLAVRAFTHGYDLFHPGVPILSHEYTRAGRRRHWDDHVSTNGVAVPWHERDAVSRARIRRMLEEPSVGLLGLGSERTLQDYEGYAGIDFRRRRIREHTRRGLEPPAPAAVDDWIQL
jgi:Glycosyltransferase (GlcNAc)